MNAAQYRAQEHGKEPLGEMAVCGGSNDPALLAGPWARFWARWIDLLLITLLLAFAVDLVFPTLFRAPAFATRIGDILAIVMLLPLALIADACLLSTWGRSPGKAVAGLAVRDRHGVAPTLDVAIARNLRLYFRGFMTGIPILALIGLIESYARVSDRGTAPWDEDSDTYVVMVVYAERTATAAVVAIALSIVIYSAVIAP